MKSAEVKPLRISLKSAEAIRELKDTPYWEALKELMVSYIEQQKTVAWHLNEKTPTFAIEHAQLSSKGSAFNFLIKYVERDVRRESESGD